MDQAEPAGREGQRRHQQYFVFVPRQQCGARSDAFGVSLSRHQGRARHGHRQCRPIGSYEEIPKDLLELVEDVLLNRRPDAPNGW